MHHAQFYLNTILIKKTSEGSLELSNKGVLFRTSGRNGQKLHSHCFSKV